MPLLSEIANPETNPEMHEKLMDTLAKIDPSMKGQLLSDWYNSVEDASRAMDLLVSLSDMMAEMTIENLEDNLEAYLNMASGQGAPHRHLGMLENYFREFKQPEERKKQIEEVCEYLAKLALKEANPERHLRLKQLIDLAINKAAEKVGVKVKAEAEIAVSKMLFGFKLDASEAVTFINTIFNREFFSHKDLRKVMDIVYPITLTSHLKSALYDVIEDIFLDDFREDATSSRLGLAHKLANAANYITTSFNIYINALSKRPRLFEGVKETLKTLQKLELERISTEATITLSSIEAGMALLDKVKSDMETISSMADSVLQKLNYSMKNFALSKLEIHSGFFTQMSDIAEMLKVSLNDVDIYLRTIAGKNAALLTSGTLSGGALFYGAFSVLQTSLVYVINFTKSYEMAVEQEGKYVSVKKRKLVFAEMLEDKRKRINADNLFDFVQYYKPSYSAYLFSVSKEFINDLKILGFEPTVADDIASTISNEIYNRPGLTDEILDYLETAIYTNLGIV